MKKENYYLGLDIGTDSVGYAVTDQAYELCKFKGEPMWGVTLFDEAELAAARRGFRAARRRLDRRQQRVSLIMELFARDISSVDEGFFRRIKSSYLFAENDEDKVRLFPTYNEQKAYNRKYPTIHHLISELMESDEKHDARLVYIAVAWLVAHRGHFLSEVDKQGIDGVKDFKAVYEKLMDKLTEGDYAIPWDEGYDVEALERALTSKQGITKKSSAVAKALFAGKAPKTVNEKYKINYDLAIKLISGSKGVKLKDLFDKEEYDELTEKSVSLSMDDEKLLEVLAAIDEEDAEIITTLKAVYDWSVLVDVLKGKATISEAKVEAYEQHKSDLALLKRLVRKYVPERYNEIFRSKTVAGNYPSYIGSNKTANEKSKLKKSTKREDFCKYISSTFKGITPDENDIALFKELFERLEAFDFMPKQVDVDNRVIPYQLYWHELNKILENASKYLPFLTETDPDGISGKDKILSVFEFRVPYYVGPLKESTGKDSRLNHWMIRRRSGRILPWNFDEIVDLDASEDAFIKRMTNTCTYMPGEDVLAKNSLVYSAFEVLNEINNIKVNGNPITVEAKQGIFNDVFMQVAKPTPKRIKDYLISNSLINASDEISGLDITIKSSLKPFMQFRRLLESGTLTPSDVEAIICRHAYSEDKGRLRKWLCEHFPALSDSDVKYIVNLKLKEFGRLSRKLLCGIEGSSIKTGETFSMIRGMWETNNNLMQLLSSDFTFTEKIAEYSKEYYAANPASISDRLDEMYVSNAVKRPIIRALDIIKDVVKAQKSAPERIFIEMARGATEDQKGKRTRTRLQQLYDLYEKVDTEDVRILKDELDGMGDAVHNKLQSDKLFLYFIQLGKCLYTGERIDIGSVISGDGAYNVEHIYPRSFVKDDSIINNLALVDSNANGKKSDKYPIDPEIQSKMRGYWSYLRSIGLLSEEKFARLTRNTHFTEAEKYEFINRQLVETRQSTKALATILKEMLPDTEIVYVKAGLVSEFRQKFDLIKSRAVNDLHHAKDAYLNVVVGNVWHSKFSKQYYRENADNNVKAEIVFTREVQCGGSIVWRGAEDKDKAAMIARKNTPHVTVYSYTRHSGQNGGFFDQNPLRAADGLIPLKNDRPTDIYGGYNGATVSGFVLAKYRIGKKTEISFVPLTLLALKRFMRDKDFAIQYVSEDLGCAPCDVELLFNGRILKPYTMLSLDGARFSIRGKANASSIGLVNMMQFMPSYDTERYVKRLESFIEKRKKNQSIVWNEEFDGISREKNSELYELYINKLSKWPYSKRPGASTLKDKLVSRKQTFGTIDIISQINVLLAIQGLFSRIKQADLKPLGESSNSGIIALSLNVSNWKKNYSDVRIIDSSASGLFEKVSEVNLLDLL